MAPGSGLESASGSGLPNSSPVLTTVPELIESDFEMNMA